MFLEYKHLVILLEHSPYLTTLEHTAQLGSNA